MTRLRVAVLDNYQGMIDGYYYRLGSHPAVAIVGAVRTGAELEALLAAAQPVHLVIADLHVAAAPDNPNPYPLLYSLPRLLQHYPGLAVLVVSGSTERELITSLLEAGAGGYIVKADAEAYVVLADIIATVAAGGTYLSQTARRALTQAGPGSANALTGRQREVLALCAAYPGDSLTDLARRLEISPNTARNLISQVYQRLNVRTRMEAVLKAQSLGLLPRPAGLYPRDPPEA